MRTLALLLLILGVADATRITPIQQVLDMMNDMKAKGESSMEEEQKIFSTYTEWVGDQTRELGFEIKTAKSTIEKLIAFIDKADEDAVILADEIVKLDADNKQLESDKADATALRESEHAEYLKVAADYSESVDALARAMDMIKASSLDVPQAMMLLQKMAIKATGMRRVVAALEESRVGQPGAPAVAGYEQQSSGIMDMLEKLFDKFKTELAEVDEEESNRQHAYDLEVLHITDMIKQNTADRDEKQSNKASLVAQSGKAKGDLAATRTDLAEDEKLLAETESTFATKKGAYAENQKVRAAELEALAKAIEIIASPEVSGFVQTSKTGKAPAFFQERSQTASARAASKQRALELLRSRAETLSSKVLSQLASEIAANPFAKVVDMIKTMIAKLKEEAQAEAAHKAWCDGELKANKLKRDKKTAKVGSLSAEYDQYQASITDMADEIALLSKEQADLQSAMADATATRQKESAVNAKTIKDAKAGKEAVGKALTVLKEFYAAQGSFLQKGKQAPEMAEYKGMSSAKGGVVGMLEVIESDFARLETDTTSAEGAAASEYTTFMADSKEAKKEKYDRVVQLKLDKDQAEFEVGHVKKDLDATQMELDKANEYYDSLKPNCLEVKVSYEERVAMRKQEIESLKEAYNILDEQ